MEASREFGVVDSTCGKCIEDCNYRMLDDSIIVLANAREVNPFNETTEWRLVAGDCYTSGLSVIHDIGDLTVEQVHEWRKKYGLGRPIRFRLGSGYDDAPRVPYDDTLNFIAMQNKNGDDIENGGSFS